MVLTSTPPDAGGGALLNVWWFFKYFLISKFSAHSSGAGEFVVTPNKNTTYGTFVLSVVRLKIRKKNKNAIFSLLFSYKSAN